MQDLNTQNRWISLEIIHEMVLKKGWWVTNGASATDRLEAKQLIPIDHAKPPTFVLKQGISELGHAAAGSLTRWIMRGVYESLST